VSAADARAYALNRGITLPAAGDATDPVEIMLVLATDYLESRSYIGLRATGTQALQWPRVLTRPYRNYPFFPMAEDSYYYLLNVDPSYYDFIPAKLIAAQCQLCIEQQNSITLLPSKPGGIDGQFITRTRVDVIETAYSEKLGTLSTPVMPAVDALLREIVIRGGGQASLRAVRV
jgi:hypothetical protein